MRSQTQTQFFSLQKAAQAEGVCDLQVWPRITVQGLSGLDSKPGLHQALHACTHSTVENWHCTHRVERRTTQFRLINPTNPAQTQALHAYCDCPVTSHGRAANCCQLVPDVSPSLQSFTWWYGSPDALQF